MRFTTYTPFWLIGEGRVRSSEDKVDADQTNTMPQITEARRTLDYQLGLLLAQVGIFLNDGEPGIEELVEKFNIIIVDVMTVARARQTKEGAEMEAAEEGGME